MTGESDLATELRRLRERLDAVERRGTYPPWHRPSSAWIEVGAVGAPAFQNGWTNYGAGWATAAYRVDSEGWLHLKGLIRNPGTGSVVFTLPSGFRPAENFSITGANYGTASTAANCHINIYPDGTVSVQSASSLLWVSINTVSIPLWPRSHLNCRSVGSPVFFPDGLARQAYIAVRRSGFAHLLGLTAAWNNNDARHLAEVGPMYGDLFEINSDGGGHRIDIASGRFYPAASAIPTWGILGGISWPTPAIEPLFTSMTMQNSWVHHGSYIEGWAYPAYYRDNEGWVHLRGLVSGGASNTTITTLPVGYRPAQPLLWPSWGGNGKARIDVYANGIVAASSEGHSGTTWVSLAGIRFLAEG